MNDQILDELRNSLNKIKTLAEQAVALNSESFVSEQEANLKDSLRKSLSGESFLYQPAEALALKQKLMSGLKADGEVFDIVQAINVLAMTNADVIHIFTRYSAHVNRFFVSVEPSIADYSSKNREHLYATGVSLDEQGALEQLLIVESKLTELIIEAREEAEANVEVGA